MDTRIRGLGKGVWRKRRKRVAGRGLVKCRGLLNEVGDL